MPVPAARDERPLGVAISVPYLPELESLRGIAMLLVLVFHVDGLIKGPFGHVDREAISPWHAFVRAGDTGVSLFFVLSAFLLSMPFLLAAAGGRPVSVRHYAARRALRILPLYYAAVAAGTVVTAAALPDLLHALPYLVFLNAVAGGTEPLRPFSNVWWSLSTEAQFYVVLPLLGLMVTRRARWIGLAGLLAYLIAYAWYEQGNFYLETIEGNILLGLSLFGRGPTFLFGIAAAALYLWHGPALRARLARPAWLRHGGADLALFAVVAAIGLLLQWKVGVGVNLTRTPPRHAWYVIEGLLWAGAVLIVLLAPLRLKALVHNRLLTRLGVLSYSVYVLHIPVYWYGLIVLRRLFPGRVIGWTPTATLAAVALGLVVVGLAALTYRYIEAPFLLRKEKVRE